MHLTERTAGDLVQHVAVFVRYLRGLGWKLGPGEAALVLESLRLVGMRDRMRVMHALRTVLARSHSEWEEFQKIFSLFWPPEMLEPALFSASMQQAKSAADGEVDVGATNVKNTMSADPIDTENANHAKDSTPLYSAAELLARRDLGGLPELEAGALQALVNDLVSRLTVRSPRRRLRRARRGAADLRRILRYNLRWGGEPLVLPRRTRAERVGRVVVLCDVSGSMEIYSRFYLQFLHALYNKLPVVESFAFSTRIVHVTPLIRRNNWPETWTRLRLHLDNWAEGTRIADALSTLRQCYGYLFKKHTALLVISDGLDTGVPDQVGDEMRKFRLLCDQILWLNPLAAHPDYEPLAKGMAAALPYVDQLLAGHNLEALIRSLEYV